LGLILIALGFIVAAAAGLWFAVQIVQGTMEPGEAARAAVLLFIPVGALVLAGIYQRHLVDLLNVRGTVPVSEMAAALQVDEGTLRELVEQLIRLEIFTGQVDWDNGVMYAAPARNQLPE
jgi:hypothetical protein